MKYTLMAHNNNFEVEEGKTRVLEMERGFGYGTVKEVILDKGLVTVEFDKPNVELWEDRTENYKFSTCEVIINNFINRGEIVKQQDVGKTPEESDRYWNEEDLEEDEQGDIYYEQELSAMQEIIGEQEGRIRDLEQVIEELKRQVSIYKDRNENVSELLLHAAALLEKKP